MKLKIWFETNLGFEATKNELRKSKIAADFQDWKGRLTVHFVDLKDYTVQITTKGKVGIFYPENSSYNVVLKKLKPYLVTAAGSSAEIIKTIDERKPPEKREYEKYLEELKKIGDLALLSPNLAWEKFTYFYTRLPLPLKKLVQEKVLPVAENSKLSDSLSLKLVINEVGLLLWGYFELSARHYKASLER